MTYDLDLGTWDAFLDDTQLFSGRAHGSDPTPVGDGLGAVLFGHTSATSTQPVTMHIDNLDVSSPCALADGGAGN